MASTVSVFLSPLAREADHAVLLQEVIGVRPGAVVVHETPNRMWSLPFDDIEGRAREGPLVAVGADMYST